MLTALLSAALALQAAPAEPVLTQEQRAVVRCSSALAILVEGQANGNPAAKKWPPLDETRAREFFVRALAQVMEQTGLDRAGINRLANREAQDLWDKGDIEKVLPSCLAMLEASGL